MCNQSKSDVAEISRPAVNGWLSDLYFNYDQEEATKYDKQGKFMGWDDKVLLENAQAVIACVQGCGGQVDCTPEELVQDFKDRV